MKADAAVKLVSAGIITTDQALEDLGYTPVQIQRNRDNRRAARLTGGNQFELARRTTDRRGLAKRRWYASRVGGRHRRGVR